MLARYRRDPERAVGLPVVSERAAVTQGETPAGFPTAALLVLALAVFTNISVEMLPMGLLIKYGAGAGFWESEALVNADRTLESYAALTPTSVVWDNLIPVILGNIVGGAVFVGIYFWAAYIKPDVSAAQEEARKNS